MKQEESVETDGHESPPSIVLSISRWMAVLACFTLAAMMIFVTIDVAGRDLFNQPLRGTVEIVGLLLIIASTWGMGLCQIEKRHLRIPLVYDRYSFRVRLWLDLLAYLVCLVTAGIVTWQVLVLAFKYFQMPHGNVSEILGLPFVPFLLALAWGFGWMCIVLAVDIYKTLREAL